MLDFEAALFLLTDVAWGQPSAKVHTFAWPCETADFSRIKGFRLTLSHLNRDRARARQYFYRARIDTFSGNCARVLHRSRESSDPRNAA